MFEGWGAAVVGAAVVGGVAKSASAGKAAKSQTKAAQAGIEAENRRFDEATRLLQPYTDAGTKSLAAQGDLAGLNGPEAQKAAVAAIEGSSEFGSLTQQGEEAILQNASATGGLRGGNTQGVLAQFRPQLLNALIDKQFNRLGGITQIGQASAAKVGSDSIQNGQDVAALLGIKGAARAGAHLANGQAVSDIANLFGSAAGGQVF